MFLKQLLILKSGSIIRDIKFHNGLNLIVDETKEGEVSTSTGNNVGKTTVLKLIYFCFGGDAKEIYTSTENSKDEYLLVKDFLINNDIVIRLVLKENLDVEDSKEIVVERNFLKRQKSYRKINGKKYTEKEFSKELKKMLFNGLVAEKPTLKQLVGHNIRYKNRGISNTIKYLDSYTKDVEYETLYLYLLGCSHVKGQQKEELLTQLSQEKKYKSRLESNATKNNYIVMLAAINNEIEKLNMKKANLNINESFEEDLEMLNNIKRDINHITEAISLLKIRKDLINESKQELEKNSVDIDLVELKTIYEEVSENLGTLNKTFSDLVNYHNAMINNKVKYITKELPLIEDKINSYNEQLTKLLEDENLPEAERKEYAEIIIEESNRLLNLSTNILRLSKIQNQGKIVRKDHINITEQLRKAIAVLENKWNEKSLTFNISAKDVYYDGDEELTFQVWMNLIDNAIKFSKPNGKITIDVKEEIDEIVVKIKDNGIGMSKEEQERIFTRFYQIDKSHSQEGSGLGLSIVKSIIDLSGGKIEVESKENSGTTFIIKLPIEKENNKIII